jgi:hypothetical protein
MNKQNILALALKPAMRVTKSVGIGIVLLLAAALIATITPSAASVRTPCEGPTATQLVTGLEGAMWKSRDDEGLSALRVPALAFAVLLLLVGCGVLMWR